MSHSPDEMYPPKEPLQRLPRQPLISPTGARLVLRNYNTGYPDHTDPSPAGRGRWFDDIADTDTKTFLRATNNNISPPGCYGYGAVTSSQSFSGIVSAPVLIP